MTRGLDSRGDFLCALDSGFIANELLLAFASFYAGFVSSCTASLYIADILRHKKFRVG